MRGYRQCLSRRRRRLSVRSSLGLRAAGLVLVAATMGCGSDSNGGSNAPQQSVFFGSSFLNIAHRGGGRLAPEHTLVAYQNALDVGADVIEFDLHATADGVIVVLHDDDVDRTTDGTGAVREMPYAELRQLDAGYRFTRDGGRTHPWRGTGLTIPTLEEALDLLQGVPLAVEIKQRNPPIAAAVLEVFEAYGAVENTVFSSFAPDPIEEIRNANPAALTALPTNELVEFSLLGDDLSGYEPPSRFIQPPVEIADAGFLERAHAVGMKVHPWTINDPGEMCEVIRLGADGLFTDDPATLPDLIESGSCAR